ncbi:hypothetical protein G4228_010239 [Cervus hanglu yarkandensis]|nr:hypothetical protein G4228_010239 [Cervus hanglu yarkandensis]
MSLEPLFVVDIMRVNVDKVLERDQKLSELDDRADALQAGASQFETSAAKLKRKYWWKNCKMWAIGISVVVIIIIIIIGEFSCSKLIAESLVCSHLTPCTRAQNKSSLGDVNVSQRFSFSLVKCCKYLSAESEIFNINIILIHKFDL